MRAQRQHVADVDAVRTGVQQCAHVFTSFFAGRAQPWTCSGCQAPLTDPTRVANEVSVAARARTEDTARAPTVAAHAKLLHRGGVTVEFLLAFTAEHHCWDWPTWRVQRDIIRPACAHHRCRYADLPSARPHTGAAGVFVSHCWGGRWGTLVAAAACGAPQGRCLWVDLFAITQQQSISSQELCGPDY